MANSDLDNEGSAAFSAVNDKLEELTDLLDGPAIDVEPDAALAAIKTSAQELLDLINVLTVADFEEEFDDIDSAEDESAVTDIFR